MSIRSIILITALCAVTPIGLSRSSVANPSMTLSVAGKGDVVIELYRSEAPNTVAHIIKLAKSGFYKDQKFYAVLKDPRPFLVRFGDPNTKTKPMNDSSIGNGGSGAQIQFENSGKSHVKGAVGLATRPESPKVGDSQFYIMLDSKPFLDGSYTVFGQVVKGMDVVSKIDVGDQVTSVTISGD
ncbi:MAG: peptidylprolyl isomerase [Fimbriimonadaceae bacterium]